MIAMAANLLIL